LAIFAFHSLIMKSKYSFIACCVIAVVFLYYRVSYSELGSKEQLKITTWDALGYYMYLPAMFIYQDSKELKWFPEIDKEYSVSGGWFYQASQLKSGTYVFKYLGGVAILEIPFFLAGHLAAGILGYKTDGFSPPYQWAIAIGALFYFVVTLIFLRKVMLKFFDDITTAITLILLCLASNMIQYVSIDSAQSHSYILPLYALILYTTIKWHEKPKIIWALLTGYIIGLATISRPTEAVMLFIPLLWNTHSKESSKEKWSLFYNHKSQLFTTALGGFIGILPQLLYWKYATGSFVYDVGSKWDFLTPHLRVLVGWEKGWFIYTPVTIFFMIGMFFIRRFPFKNAVLTFCLLNIYIIISWHIWRYGGSYSTRALVQSYPVFALPFAAFISKVSQTKWRYGFYVLGLYLLFVNLFQIRQYNDTILHYDDMNRKYYCSIYLNSHPTPLDMSLLDTPEILKSEKGYTSETILSVDTALYLKFSGDDSAMVTEILLSGHFQTGSTGDSWLKIESQVKITNGFHTAWLNTELRSGDALKQNRIRLFSPISQKGASNKYIFYVKVPSGFNPSGFRLFITSQSGIDGIVGSLRITFLHK
jgi:hypothetical protein